MATASSARAANIADLWAGVAWGESDRALFAHFGSSATVVNPPIDFGDSWVEIVLRNASIGGVPMIAFFEVDKKTGGLKRIQIERPRHGVNLPAVREIVGALQAEFGAPSTTCSIAPAAANGYQAAAEAVWLRDSDEIRAVFRDTTIEALEGCLWPWGLQVCGLTGQLFVRVSPIAAADSSCAAQGSR
jgi:hypothetical protein